MHLTKLELRNFQGIKSLNIDIDEKTTMIYGDNATGKTTIANSLSWLLFDKSSTGEKGFTPKTIGKEGELHNLNHEVTATFSDGKIEKTLTKTYYEKYTKVRGRATKEFSGHTTDYTINGVPSKKKEFDAEIEQLFGNPEQLQTLTNPLFFPEIMDWQKRREILINMCGDITNEDVIKAMGDEGEVLKPLLETQTVEQINKTLKARKSLLNKEIETLPGRIDEAERAIPDIATDGTEGEKIAVLEDRMQYLKGSIKSMKEDANKALEDEIKSIEAQMRNDRLTFENTLFKTNAKKHENHIAVLRSYQIAEINFKSAKEKSEELKRQIKDLKNKRESLLAKFKIIKAETFKHDGKCPTCGQEMPAEAIAEAQASFNKQKSEKLEAINVEGQKYSSDTIKKLEEMLKQYQLDMTEYQAQMAELEAEAAKITNSMSKGKYEDSPQFKEAKERKEQLGKDISVREAAIKTKTAKHEAEIEEIAQRIEAIRDRQAQTKLAEVQKKRIKELEQEQKNMSDEYEKVEQILYATELFARKKAEMLDELINKEFKSVRFKLTEDQINGGTKDVCEVIVPSPDGSLVHFGSANNAARINAGLEIIERLANFWQVQIPVFIDNAESITNIQETELQTIQLYVSEPDKTLRIA